MSKLKCVYALEMSNATVKIGMSQNVKQRIAAITGASGLSVLNCYNTKMFAEEIARTIEKACHENFSAYRIKGEFFNIAFSDACEILKKLVTEYELKTNGVQVFDHEKFGKIRTIIINDEIWFVAADVCRALGIKNIRQNLSNLKEDEKAAVCIPYTSSNGVMQKRKVNVVNEPGLYRLIFASRKPEAEELQHLVYHEILPSIRKYGYYKVENFDDSKEFIPEGLESAVKFAKQNNIEYEFEVFEEIVNGEKIQRIGMNTISNGEKYPVCKVVFDD